MIVYSHIRVDNGNPFYIGIGSTIKRAYQKDGRNDIWNKIVNKTPYFVEVLYEGLTKEEACAKEIELISKFGRIHNNSGILANITKGGEILIGSENPMFNNGKKIEIDNIIYNSIADAARKLNLHWKTIRYRLTKDTFPNYRKLFGDVVDIKYSDEEIKQIKHNRNRGKNNPMYGKRQSKKMKDILLIYNKNKKLALKEKLINAVVNPNRKEVIIDNSQYMSIGHAAHYLKISHQYLSKYLNKSIDGKIIGRFATNNVYDKNLILKYICATDEKDLTIYPDPKFIEMLQSH